MKRQPLSIAARLLAGAMFLTAGCGDAGWSPLGPSRTSGQSADGDFTILLCTFSDTAHVRNARRYKQATEDQTNWKNIFVIHKADHSQLCCGRYRSIEDAQPNLRRAKQYVTPANIGVYKKAIILRLRGEDIGPPELKLKNARGAHSVLVAIFEDDPKEKYFGRKTDAIRYCERLREHGYEAYYHHGLAKSSVTVGAFPESSVQRIKEGHVTRCMISDPGINAILDDEQFEYLAINGQRQRTIVVDPKTGRAKWIDLKPYTVHIPKKDNDGQATPDHSGNAQ